MEVETKEQKIQRILKLGLPSESLFVFTNDKFAKKREQIRKSHLPKSYLPKNLKSNITKAIGK